MTDDDEEKRLRLELLAADLSLRRKQEFWTTPRNVAILVGVTAAVAAAIGFWLGRESAPSDAPLARPVFGIGGLSGAAGSAQFIDAVETAGIVVIAAMLIYVVVRLDRALTAAAREIRGALTTQSALQQGFERLWQRVELVERLQDAHVHPPAAELTAMLGEIRNRLDRLEGGNGH